MVHDVSHRLQWQALPPHVREWIEEALGGQVVEAVGQRGGYGPGMAARCKLVDGRRYFVKAASPAQNPDTPNMIRGEARINAILPEGAPAPRLLHVLDDGEWVVLIFEDLAGREPGSPWTEEELQLVARAAGELNSLPADPSLSAVADRYASSFNGWEALQDASSDRIPDEWSRRHLTELAELEVEWAAGLEGDGTVHGDLRADNILVLDSGRAIFVDWTSTCRGNGVFDIAAGLPSIELAGGGSPEHVLEVMGLHLDKAALTPFVAALAGYFVSRGSLPDPPGLPTVRAFQRAQGEVTTSWLRRLTGWD